jgi:hypothetical protein
VFDQNRIAAGNGRCAFPFEPSDQALDTCDRSRIKNHPAVATPTSKFSQIGCDIPMHLRDRWVKERQIKT